MPLMLSPGEATSCADDSMRQSCVVFNIHNITCINISYSSNGRVTYSLFQFYTSMFCFRLFIAGNAAESIYLNMTQL